MFKVWHVITVLISIVVLCVILDRIAERKEQHYHAAISANTDLTIQCIAAYMADNKGTPPVCREYLKQ